MSNQSKPYALRLPAYLMAEIKRQADAETRSINQMIVVVLKEWLATHASPNKETSR